MKCSTEVRTSPAGGAINGDRRLYLNYNAWANSTATFPQWLQVDFNGSKTIDEIDVFSVQDLYAALSEPTPDLATAVTTPSMPAVPMGSILVPK